MKFNLTVNSQQQDGFKLTFDAQTKEELEICKLLSSKLIEKITKISVEVKNESYEE